MDSCYFKSVTSVLRVAPCSPLIRDDFHEISATIDDEKVFNIVEIVGWLTGRRVFNNKDGLSTTEYCFKIKLPFVLYTPLFKPFVLFSFVHRLSFSFAHLPCLLALGWARYFTHSGHIPKFSPINVTYVLSESQPLFVFIRRTYYSFYSRNTKLTVNRVSFGISREREYNRVRIIVENSFFSMVY